MTPTVPAGGLLVLCAAVSGALLGRGQPAATWLLVLALLACGALLMRRVSAPMVGAVAATVAAQLAAAGLAAVRVAGATPRALGVVAVGALAAGVGAAVAWRVTRFSSAPNGRALLLGTAAAVALAPLLVLVDPTTLRYGLPWGGALLATGWLKPVTARTVRLTVLASVAATLLTAAAGAIGTTV